MKPEHERSHEEKRTYVAQIPGSVPNLDKLIRFYQNDESILKGALLAVPVSNDDLLKKVLGELQNDSNIELTIGNYCNDPGVLLPLFSFSSEGIRNI